MNMNLQQNYDALKPQIAARKIGIGDVLVGESGRRYLLVEGDPGCVQMNQLWTGERFTCIGRVGDIHALTYDEAVRVCGQNLASFRLVGRAGAVLKVEDPGE